MCSRRVEDQVLPARGALPPPRPSRFQGPRPTCQAPAPPVPGGFLVPAERAPLTPSLSVRGASSTFTPCPQLVCARCDRVLTSCFLSPAQRGPVEAGAAILLQAWGIPHVERGTAPSCSEGPPADGRVRPDFSRRLLPPATPGARFLRQPRLVPSSSLRPWPLSLPEGFWSPAFSRFEDSIREHTTYRGTSPGSTL